MPLDSYDSNLPTFPSGSHYAFVRHRAADILLNFNIMLYRTFPFAVLITVLSCTADELPPPSVAADCEDTPTSYDLNIKPIIDNSCAYSGCHLSGGAPGNYSSYQRLRGILEDGSFRSRVLNLRDDPNVGMPPNYAPEGRPKDLTQEELQLIECWLADGFPES